MHFAILTFISGRTCKIIISHPPLRPRLSEYSQLWSSFKITCFYHCIVLLTTFIKVTLKFHSFLRRQNLAPHNLTALFVITGHNFIPRACNTGIS